jgi:hypothetical protein
MIYSADIHSTPSPFFILINVVSPCGFSLCLLLLLLPLRCVTNSFAQAAKPLGASWNDPLVKPHTASFGRALADMRIDELHGVSLCLEQIRDRVQQERALKKELVKQARGVERQSSATNATSPRGSSEDATKLRRSSVGGSGGSGGGGQVMDPKFSEQLSPTEMANIKKAFKELDKDGSGAWVGV